MNLNSQIQIMNLKSLSSACIQLAHTGLQRRRRAGPQLSRRRFRVAPSRIPLGHWHPGGPGPDLDAPGRLILLCVSEETPWHTVTTEGPTSSHSQRPSPRASAPAGPGIGPGLTRHRPLQHTGLSLRRCRLDVWNRPSGSFGTEAKEYN